MAARLIETLQIKRQTILAGLKDGLPIALGYLPVSFAFGLIVVEGGLSPATAVLISLTNLTSAGQFAGVQMILAGTALYEIALTTLLINLRYMLMSLSLSQKIRPGISLPYRLAIGYGITDEVYAVAIHRPGALGPAYCLSLMALPVSGWTTGTLLGALAGTILPDTLRSALGIALYAMFVAIVMPSTRQSRPIRLVVLLAAALSTLIAAWPRLSALRGGWQIIIATILAALAGAWFAPIQDSGPTARPAAGGAGHD